MEFQFLHTKIRISYLFAAVLTLFFLYDRDGMFWYVLSVVALHEMGHLLAMWLLRAAPGEIDLCFFGIRISRREAARLTYLQEGLIHLAGPAVNLLAWILCLSAKGEMSRLYGWLHLFTGLFNLLPAGNLDGGNLLSLLGQRFFPVQQEWITKLVSFVVLVPLFTMGLLLVFQNPWNFSLLFTAVYLFSVVLFGPREE